MTNKLTNPQISAIRGTFVGYRAAIEKDLRESENMLIEVLESTEGYDWLKTDKDYADLAASAIADALKKLGDTLWQIQENQWELKKLLR